MAGYHKGIEFNRNPYQVYKHDKDDTEQCFLYKKKNIKMNSQMQEQMIY